MTQRIGTLTIAGALLLAGATFAFAGGPGGPGGHDLEGLDPDGPCGEAGAHAGFGRLGHALHRLDLSHEQRLKLHAILDAHRDDRFELREQMRTRFEARADEELAAEFDEAAVRARAEERARAMVELEVARAKVTSEVLAVLTPEQRAELAKMREERHERFGRFDRDDRRPGRRED